MRMIVHFGETLPEKITPEHIISSSLLFIWALAIFFGMLFCFGIGAATGDPFVVSVSLNLHGIAEVVCRYVYAYIHTHIPTPQFKHLSWPLKLQT